MKTIALFVMMTATFGFADDKEELYRKGMQAVDALDAIAARDAFCAVAKKDADYKDSKAQCQTQTEAAQRMLIRYKVDYAEGITAMQNHDYDTAAMKFRLVRQGDFADRARTKLAELDQLKAQSAKQRSAEFMETLNIGNTAGSFTYACGQNAEFEKTSATDQQSTRAFFCAGWVRGVSDLLRLQQSKLATKAFCLTADVTVDQETALLLKYIKDHPAESAKPTSGMLDAALRKAYPCRAKK